MQEYFKRIMFLGIFFGRFKGPPRFDVLGASVCDFLAWRTEAEGQSLDQILRLQRLRRFNVVSLGTK